MKTNEFDPNQLFDAEYFRYGLGDIAYERSEHWINFFGMIAQHIIQDFAPQTALDVGCAIGLLVEALRDQQVDAQGFDISEYAISQVPQELRHYIKRGSITDPDVVFGKYDLVICIEVVEHLPPEDADDAINNLCQWSNTILFSSSPSHFDEPTHFNVQPPGYWVEKFAHNGFFQVLDYDGNYITPWAMLLRRETPIWPSILRRYANHAWTKHNQAHDLRQLVNTIQHTRYANEATVKSLREQLQSQQAEYASQLNALQTQLADQRAAYDAEILTLQDTVNRLQQTIEHDEAEFERELAAFEIKESELQEQLQNQVTALESAQYEQGQLVTRHGELETELRDQLRQQETAIDELHREREQVIAQYEAILVELRQQVADQQGTLMRSKYEQGRLVATQEAVAAELRRQLEEQMTAVKDAQLEQGRLIGTHSEVKTRFEQELADTQETIRQLKHENEQSLVVHRDIEARLRQEIDTKQSMIDNIQHNFEVSTHQYQMDIAELNSQLTFVRANLHVMRSTRGWRTLEAWWRFKKRVFPPGSRRERLYHLFRSAVETLLKYGPWALVTQMSRWVRKTGKRTQTTPSPLTVSMMNRNRDENLEKSASTSEDGFLIYPVGDAAYAAHIQTTEPTLEDLETQIADANQWSDKPVFSIVTPIYQPPLSMIRQAVQSVRSQTYPHWEWHLVDASPDDEIWNYLVEKAKHDPRLKPIRITENLGISGNTNIALKQVIGDYVVMLDHDDTLASHALYTVASLIRQHPDADFIYSDMDKLDEQGRRCEPLFKPDWSPELLLCANYLCQISVFRSSLLEHVGYLDSQMDGAQDWDFYLRISEYSQRIYHIPQVLYHWRKSRQSAAQNPNNKPYIKIAQITTLTNHLRRRGLKEPRVIFDNAHPIHNTHPLVTWQPQKNYRISIIVPCLNQLDVLKTCLESVFRLTTYPNFQVILVDSGGDDPTKEQIYQQFAQHPSFKMVMVEEPSNFSKAYNFGAAEADGDLLLFLDNDTVVLDREWLGLLSQWFDNKEVGIVGPKLLYPNGNIQHAGLYIGLGALAGPLFAEAPENISTMFGTDGWYRNLLAVSGACLMISRVAFSAVGGFDEAYQLNYSDIELCLRVYEAGYRIVYTPQVRLLHHESVTHGRSIPRSDFERASQRWQLWLEKGDPYFNPNLTCTSATPAFRRGAQDTPQRLNADLMARMPNKLLIQLPRDLV